LKIHDMPWHSFAILNVQECGVEHLTNEYFKMYDWKCWENVFNPWLDLSHMYIIMHIITKMKWNINVSIMIVGNTIIYIFRYSHYVFRNNLALTLYPFNTNYMIRRTSLYMQGLYEFFKIIICLESK